MSLSESASAQVQAILQAAETSAAEIKREAEAEAERIRAAARENQQADVSGLLEMVAKLRADLDGLEARLKEVAKDAPAPPQAAKPETAKTTRAPKSPPAAPKDEAADAEGARLIALNMALNGEPREATDKYLAENFNLSDRDRLLDEVYASVEG